MVDVGDWCLNCLMMVVAVNKWWLMMVNVKLMVNEASCCLFMMVNDGGERWWLTMVGQWGCWTMVMVNDDYGRFTVGVSDGKAWLWLMVRCLEATSWLLDENLGTQSCGSFRQFYLLRVLCLPIVNQPSWVHRSISSYHYLAGDWKMFSTILIGMILSSWQTYFRDRASNQPANP